jgi:hypothetical protein
MLHGRVVLLTALALLFAPRLVPPARADGLPAGDGGWAWQNPLPQGNTLQSVHFVSREVGWVLGDGGTIRTDDGCKTWQPLYTVPPQPSFRDVSFPDSRNGWVLGSGDVMWRTRDGGKTWVLVKIGFAANEGSPHEKEFITR